ncbi:hypothetical protein P691DRAFT_429417 [Macrolepiota fuliginosa MF-IS2]|uniref:FAD-binding FR-type domain-containing protein n=1 Tax=Macrolepiota fuliginosa MF-IS2 TaxID=1400762 RepID=A0A9P5XJF7_9AGAR|nr:hypothetical protein P691DRAFT_429417 [Macrolepiota fuliginosa MF-IS2]
MASQVVSFPASAASAASEPQVSSEKFLFHISLFIIAIIGVVFFYRLPRAIALFGSPEWLSGHILRYIPFGPTRPVSQARRIVQAYYRTYPPPNQPPSPTLQGHDMLSDESHTMANHQQNFKRVDALGHEVEMQYPTHIASCPSFMRWTLNTLRHRTTPNYSVGQVIILTGYFWILIYATFFNSNFFVDYNRVGWISVAQLPFVMAYATKNNVLGTLLGMGYERLNFLHRFAGRIVIIAANLHGIGFTYKWSLAGTFRAQIAEPKNAWGLLALICLDVLFLFSLAYWRQRAYNIFFMVHILCFSLLMPALWHHRPELIPYVLGVLGLYGLDYVFRFFKTRVVTATIRPLPELDLTRIEIPTINAGWRAGQHVRVRILSTGVGWLGWTEMHPFTIASVASSDHLIGNRHSNASDRWRGGGGGEEGMVLMCKNAGTWTRRLFEMAKMSGYVDGFIGREVKLWIEGPYGGSGHVNFASFSAAVIVVGGSGITFGLSVVKDLVEKDLKGMSRVKAIELVWSVPDPASLIPLLPTLATLINQSVFTPLRISVHYTRATPNPPSIPSIPGLSLSPGRPRLAKIVDYAVSKALSIGTQFDFRGNQPEQDEKGGRGVGRSHSRRDKDSRHGHGHYATEGTEAQLKIDVDVGMVETRDKEDIQDITGVIVGVCGPVELSKDVVNAVETIDGERRNRVGGIEIHEEVFGW